MDFARKQLLKYGWNEGKGLGRNEDGIAQSIKPALKFDTTGVGHDSSEQFTFNWWEQIYNEAADNIEIQKTNGGAVNIKIKSEDSVDITTKKYSRKKLKKRNIDLEYGSFLKTAKLTTDGIVDLDDKPSFVENTSSESKFVTLSDGELFAACEGRTAHKGARHGLNSFGKISRLEQQEILFLKNMKEKANNLHENMNKTTNNYTYQDEYSTNQNKYKKRFENSTSKRKRCVSFDYCIDLEKKFESDSSLEKKKRKCSKREKETKRIDNIANMLENVCVVNPQQDKDDGFVENTDESVNDKHANKKRKKKKEKVVKNVDENDDGFEECINEVNEKLIVYKEFRRVLQTEKRKHDENQIAQIAEDFEKTL